MRKTTATFLSIGILILVMIAVFSVRGSWFGQVLVSSAEEFPLGFYEKGGTPENLLAGERFESGAGEQLRIVLANGIIIELHPDTKAKLDVSNRNRNQLRSFRSRLKLGMRSELLRPRLVLSEGAATIYLPSDKHFLSVVAGSEGFRLNSFDESPARATIKVQPGALSPFEIRSELDSGAGLRIRQTTAIETRVVRLSEAEAVRVSPKRDPELLSADGQLPQYIEVSSDDLVIGASAEGTTSYIGDLDQITANISWKSIPGVDKYLVRIFKGNRVLTEEVATGRSYALKIGAIDEEEYSFQISAEDTSGIVIQSPISPIRITLSPPKPQKVLPADSTGQRIAYMVTWQKTALTPMYEMEMALDREFRQIHLRKLTQFNYEELGNLPVGRYYWRVRSVFPGRASPWSDSMEIQIPLGPESGE